jgi:parvulin-like peptidyl-prolyl isomerase
MTRFSAVLLLSLLVTAAPAQGIYPGDAVRVNDETISYQRFNGFYVEYRNSRGVQVGARGDQLELLTQLRKEAMDRMIEQVLVKQAAKSEGIEADPNEVDDRIRADAADVSDTELERYYHENEYRLTFPEQVRVRHILLTWKPLGTQDDRAAIRRQMEPILERARNGEDFAALAAEFSEDFATKSAGGDTGLFYRGQMAAAFEEAAFALEPGEIPDPVETGFGVHILKLEERLEARLVPLDEVREKLRDHVRDEKMEAAVRAKIDELRAAADIEVLIAIEPPKSGG